MEKKTEILFLFDIDGTLTPSRDTTTPEIQYMIKELRSRVSVGIVSGSDLLKQKEQIGPDVLDLFDYVFPENGAQYYDHGKLVHSCSLIEYLGEGNYKELVNKMLFLLSKSECPVKRGNFFELRDSMLNISPIGRSCTRKERHDFLEYDKVHCVRQKICDELKEDLSKMGMRSSIGGQISIDIFPLGWDKTLSLKNIKQDKIFFFGDMVKEGGNDYEIYTHERVVGIAVTEPNDTFMKVNQQLKKLGIPEIKSTL
ncbi:Phosphomannomutase 1 [Glugoides intestinalis]